MSRVRLGLVPAGTNFRPGTLNPGGVPLIQRNAGTRPAHFGATARGLSKREKGLKYLDGCYTSPSGNKTETRVEKERIDETNR